MPDQTFSPYRLAQLAARDRAGNLTQASARRVLDALQAWVRTLTDRLNQLPVNTPAARRQTIVAMRDLAARAGREMETLIFAAVRDHRRLAFEDVFRIWQAATRSAVAEELRVRPELGTAAAVHIGVPNVTLAGAYEGLGGAASTWTQSVAVMARAATRDVDAIVSHALVGGLGPQELARRLIPYMQGAEEFERLFPRADERLSALYGWRRANPEIADAARQLRAKALRVAYSEIHNARAEAELTAFAVDPLVHAIRWELSPFRGSLAGPDVCDALARNDWYGLGAGVYPIDRVPLPPHPRDRCERIPVTVSVAEARKHAAPRNVPRVLDFAKARVGATGGQTPITPEQALRIRQQLARQFREVEQVIDPAAMHKLMQQGDRAAAALGA